MNTVSAQVELSPITKPQIKNTLDCCFVFWIWDGFGQLQLLRVVIENQ